jgi:hypothetical protein
MTQYLLPIPDDYDLSVEAEAISGETHKARLVRNRPASPTGISFSISSCMLCHIGTARASTPLPFAVSDSIRLRRSAGSGDIFTSPRCSSGFKAAVSVVRSIANSDATGRIDGGSGRFSDINSENCPFVSSNGRSASSNRRAKARAARCTCRHRQQSRTKRVVSYGTAG